MMTLQKLALEDRPIVVLAIKPEYAAKIYSGEKRWEFRTVPPPLPGWALLYESAPVSKITGCVYLEAKIEGWRETVWELIRLSQVARDYGTTDFKCGISEDDFFEYTRGRRSVAALYCYGASKFATPCSLPPRVRPPQNFYTIKTSKLITKD